LGIFNIMTHLMVHLVEDTRRKDCPKRLCHNN
jgi:hypothetical protein